MKMTEMIATLSALDRRGVYVFAKRDIEKMFPNEKEKALEKSLQRMVKDGFLVRAARGVYVNPAATSKSGYVIEDVAKALRPGEMCYVSLESILSEYGVISQIPISMITIMTTGANGTYETPFGTIEFTHTKRRLTALLSRTVFVKNRPLRIATKEAAIRDLCRVGRNTNMINENETLEED